MSELLTVKQTALRLAISSSLLYRLVAEGKIRCFRLGRSALRFSEEQISDYLSLCELSQGPVRRIEPVPSLRHLKV
jgi:excisionase family DNA binding protein